MPRRATILYCFAWILYAAFAAIAFPRLNSSVFTPVSLLLGLGAWMYGTTRGLVIILPAMVFHMYLLSYLHADIFNWYQGKATSPIIQILIVELLGNLRKQYDWIKETNEQLDQLVEKRNKELALLTAQLLKNSEKMKIANGQQLHDGIGQQLTGVQLLSTSLSEQLLAENNPLASISHHLKIKTNKAHNHVRKISRLLFPVRIEQVGLIPALYELVSCLNAIKPIRATVTQDDELPRLPEHLLLQLFRICQESAFYITDHLGANRLTINVTPAQSNIIVTLEHNGTKSTPPSVIGASSLIHYRLKLVNGTQKNNQDSPGKQTKTFIIPFQSIPS